MKAFFVAIALILIPNFVSSAHAQRRDYMTDPEIELIRDSQEIDKRIDVLTKMIDRRFTALGIDSGGWKAAAKEQKAWGDAPTGSRSQLFADIRQLLQKAVDDIDDVAEHNANTQTANKVEGPLFPTAVRSLAAAATRYRPVLNSELPKTTDERDKGMILNAIELCDSILESVVNLPPEVITDKKKGKSKT
jgi:hypothetical protein